MTLTESSFLYIKIPVKGHTPRLCAKDYCCSLHFTISIWICLIYCVIINSMSLSQYYWNNWCHIICRTLTDDNQKNNVLTHSSRTKRQDKKVPKITRRNFVFKSMASPQQQSLKTRRIFVSGLSMFLILNYPHSCLYPFFLIRLHQMGQQRVNLNRNSSK